MKAVIQRVARAQVRSGGELLGTIETGLLVLLGTGDGDTSQVVDRMAARILSLRIFEDEDGKMNLALAAAGGSKWKIRHSREGGNPVSQKWHFVPDPGRCWRLTPAPGHASGPPMLRRGSARTGTKRRFHRQLHGVRPGRAERPSPKILTGTHLIRVGFKVLRS